MTQNTQIAVVILAAGKGTRMKSDKPKVMHDLLGLPMINWVLKTVEQLNPARVIVVTGEGMDDLKAAATPYETVVQPVQNGTGGALMAAMPALDGFTGDIVVLLGDTPLVSLDTIEGLIAARHNNDVGISVLGVELENPTGYGRLLMNADGTLQAIREHKDASEAERKTRVVNTGAFCLGTDGLNDWLAQIGNENASDEYYITDLPEIAARQGVKTSVALAVNADEVRGCNTRVDLNNLEHVARRKLCEEFMLQGVSIQDPATTYMHHDTKIAAGVIIEPNVFFGKNVTVDAGVHIKAFCHFEDAHIGENVTIGPFARLRPGANIGKNARIGNYVEVKNSNIGQGSKVNHFGYVGDCDMGEGVNFSCGAITVNYDGFDKHRTIIGDNVMVGSNVNLVAPVSIGDGAFIAAGSTITKDVPADALSMTRPETDTREGWAAKFRKIKTAANKK
ncbi:MAG: bifunctional UDP-N-acetylglucosamine diphosphorylase/glucosamine-1-phosphate N-acetyltransferase GlmU [Alphaproteobacteria bacterium]